ncbi:MAG TPA: nucleoside triphosphate pyrophosphohydrolase [Clostridiales bacterium]|nr:nucleoside triphosphate pyrophosphohydrolase [Clostridiales bacterium]
MANTEQRYAKATNRLLVIMEKLRSENGCPWDKEQTHQSLRKYLIEECYEVIDAINRNDDNDLTEELGDLLLQVVFHAQLGKERDAFDFADVADGISEKMVRRHPHVFGDLHCGTADEVLVHWAKIKEEEKQEQGKVSRRLDVPATFPALYRAQKVQKKAAEVGFDWAQSEDVKAKINEEIAEVQAAIDGSGDLKEEIGDVLFAAVNWSRFHHIDAEEALRESTEKFTRRFYRVEDAIKADGKDITAMSLTEMDAYWDKIKTEEN